MQKLATLAVLAVLALAAAPALAGDAREVALTGWIVDAQCGLKNANAEGKDCILMCHKNGSPLVLASGGKLYELSDQALARQNVGHEVVVKGTLDGDAVKVAAIAKPEKKG